MNAEHSMTGRSRAVAGRRLWRYGFTLVEILIVISIIALLMTIMAAVVGSSLKTARTAATSALIQKLDNLLDERTKGFDRATKTDDFKRIVAARKLALESGGIFGVSPDVLGAVATKDFFRLNFPQRYQDFSPALTASGLLAGVPTRILTEPALIPEDVNVNGVLDAGEDTNGNGVLDGYIHFKHKPETESSALLYFMLTRMQVFGVPPVGDLDFGTSEVRDTDGDGLLEFVDAWGRPLRFYRWPTRLLKPNGILGADNQPGVAGGDDNSAFNSSAAFPNNVFKNTIFDNVVDDYLEFGKVGTDDITVSAAQRAIAGFLIDGLPTGPVIAGQWDSLSEDPDDPYGLISTEIKRLLLQSNGATNVTLGVTGFNEMNYPTIDTYHTPLIISAGADGDFGLYLPNLAEDLNGNNSLDAGEDTNGNGVLDYGILAQPIHGPAVGSTAAAYNITTSVFSTTTDVISALTDNITNRNRRAGRGK